MHADAVKHCLNRIAEMFQLLSVLNRRHRPLRTTGTNDTEITTCLYKLLRKIV